VTRADWRAFLVATAELIGAVVGAKNEAAAESTVKVVASPDGAAMSGSGFSLCGCLKAPDRPALPCA
jgi:hypothetical protein